MKWQSGLLLSALFLVGCNEGSVSNCPEGEIVDGVCLPRDCPESTCPDGFVCLDDQCVDPDCIGVSCAQGSTCAGGNCYPTDCLWRNCPGLGEVCVEEECEPVACVGVECPEGQLCADGRCYPQDCQTHNCPGYGQVCIMEECIDRSCVGVECPPGQRCAGGYCYPADCDSAGCFGEGEVCVDGECVRRSCVDIVCGQGMACANGYCYPVDCAELDCSDFGEVCVDGLCQPADCVGVQCPAGQACAHGECFAEDCATIECRANEVCYLGRCLREVCVGVSCPPGQHCADGECVVADCVDLNCGIGEYCAGGACLPNDCAHVECPAGEQCGGDGNCHPKNCLGTTCGDYEICVDDVCVDQLCVGISCAVDEACSGGQCYPSDCQQACLPGDLCIDGECQAAECGGCRCCPDQVCSMDSQCAVATCCGVEHICSYSDELGGAIWSEGGSSCSDGNPCTSDRCVDGLCQGAPLRCDSPPADYCDGDTRHAHPTQGVCDAGGGCQYPEVVEECDYACQDGACVGEPCGGINCDPYEQCVGGVCSCSGTGPDCDASQTCCSGQCVDTQTDAANCGFCGLACGANAHCDGGACACEGSFGNCNGDWTDGCEQDTQSSLTHCGTCGSPCPAGVHADVSCQSGSCTYACQGDWQDCDTDPRTCEADPSSDDDHCGSCGFACGANARCLDSTCVCDSGWLDCNQSWQDGCEVDGQSDFDHCGECFANCQAGANTEGVCLNGNCAFGCLDGWLDCDADPRTCEVDGARDAFNCGGCGNACGPAAECLAANCSCYDGYGNCDDDWQDGCETDTSSSLEHCGGCDDACVLPHASELCVGSNCRVDQCDPNFGNCNTDDADGCESNLLGDPDNCGSCDYDCGQNSICGNGNCGCTSGWGDCVNGTSDGCEQALNTLNHCTACGVACAPANGDGDCGSGACVVTGCDSNYWDVNSLVGDGCECLDAADQADTCGGAVGLGSVTLSTGQGTTATMVNIPGVHNDVDCFRVTLSASGACNFTFGHTGGANLTFTGYADMPPDMTAGCTTARCEGAADPSFHITCGSGSCTAANAFSGTVTICVRATNQNAPLCLPYAVSASCN